MQNWIQKLDGSEFKILRLQETPTAREVDLFTPQAAVNYIRPLLLESLRYSSETENLGIICLNTRRRPIGWQIISNGTLDTLLVRTAEVFRPAIVLNAASLIVFHNHPSGDPSPSEADIKVTRDLIRAGELLKIPVLDHLILGTTSDTRASDFVSLRELGYWT